MSSSILNPSNSISPLSPKLSVKFTFDDLGLSPPFWKNDEAFMELVALLLGVGIPVYLVGGCVRRALLEATFDGAANLRNFCPKDGKAGVDYDLATPTPIQEVYRRLKENKGVTLKILDQAIEYGTLVLVDGGVKAELTSFRQDVATDGRQAKIEPVDDMTLDAQRRDFTCNALYATVEGKIFDPTGQGLEDLFARRVRFVGKPDERIEEDHLRILRLLRFQSLLSNKPLSSKYKAVVCRWSWVVPSLSPHRRWQEFTKMLTTPHAQALLRFMVQPVGGNTSKSRGGLKGAFKDASLVSLMLGGDNQACVGPLPPALGSMGPLLVAAFFETLGLACCKALPLARSEKKTVDFYRGWIERLKKSPSKITMMYFSAACKTKEIPYIEARNVLTLGMYAALWPNMPKGQNRHNNMVRSVCLVKKLAKTKRQLRSRQLFLDRAFRFPFVVTAEHLMTQGFQGKEIAQALNGARADWARLGAALF